MRLLEHEAKKILSSRNVTVPSSYLISSAQEIKTITGPVMLKAQVPTGGRGKAGGVVKATEIGGAVDSAASILERPISGFMPSSILVEDMVEGQVEIYMGLTIDRASRSPTLIVSAKGGMDIENVPFDDVLSIKVDIFEGISNHTSREVASFLGIGHENTRTMHELLTILWKTFREMDCELVEINPLILSPDGRMIAVDAKITINDDALFRHPDLGDGTRDLRPMEAKARKKGISLVQLDGDIGVIANGAGLTMATLDAISLHGGKGGAFLDLGGTDDPKKVVEAFELMHELAPKVILVNIFGGITKCDTVAAGIVEARDKLRSKVPLVVRIKGVNEKEALAILSESGIEALSELDPAAAKACVLEGLK